MLGRAVELLEGSDGVELIREEWLGPREAGERVRRAAADGVDCVVAAGGDGTVNSVATGLVGSAVPLGILPSGSGNGFARHFGIPLAPARAVQALADAAVQDIDVGVVNDMPFLVTCSMAWDAAFARSFEKIPGRGVFPYVLAGVYEFLQYEPQKMEIEYDDGRREMVDDLMLFTIANVTQYGGGAKIAPHARADDGRLELVMARRRDMPILLPNIARLFTGSIAELEEIMTRSFRSLTVRREHAAPIQVDGELVQAPADVTVRVLPAALKVLVPQV